MHDFVTRKSGKLSDTAFSAIESLVVIVVMLALFFVLAPSVAYKMGWMTPPRRDMDIQIREVRHPTASRIPSLGKPKQEQGKLPQGELPVGSPKP